MVFWDMLSGSPPAVATADSAGSVGPPVSARLGKDCQGPASHIARDIQRDEAVFVRHNEERLGQAGGD